MSQGLVRVVCVGGPWDGLDQEMPGILGVTVQFPYSEKQAALLTREPEPDDPLPKTHTSI